MWKLLAAAVLSVVLAAAAGSGAWSQGTEAPLSASMKLALANVMTEMQDCITFYGIVAVGMRGSGDEVSATRAERLQEGLMVRVHIIADKIGMKRAAVRIRQKWSLERQMKLIGRDTVNVAILIDRYGAPCKILIQNFKARLRHWLEKAKKDVSRTPPTRR